MFFGYGVIFAVLLVIEGVAARKFLFVYGVRFAALIGIEGTTIVVVLVLFRRQDRLAGWLLIPYVIWVGYASYLNAWYWILNG